MFGKNPIPSIGFSLGMERIFVLIESKKKSKGIRSNVTDVYVASIDKNLIDMRMEICAMLWRAGINAEFMLKANPRIKPQLEQASKSGAKYAVILGANEKANRSVQVKNLTTKGQEEVKLESLVRYVCEKLQKNHIGGDNFESSE